MTAFAEEAALDPPALESPQEWTGLAEFDKLTKKAISQLRSRVPGIEEQKTLLKRQQAVLRDEGGLGRPWATLG